MKTLLFILASFSLTAQLPLVDNFDPGTQWSINHGFLYEDINTGQENGYLTFNTGSSTLLDFRQYEFQSPDYSERISNCGCDSIKVTIKVDMSIRTLDQVKLFYIVGGIGKYKVIPSSGVYSFVLPIQTQYFTFNLVTWGGGSLAGKYVHLDQFLIECKDNPLPVKLTHFCAKKADRFNVLVWETANEINSDYFLLEKSTDCQSWTSIGKFYTGANSYENKTYNTKDYPTTVISYYRLSQFDLNGDNEVLGIRSVMNDSISTDKVISVINSLGQQVDKDFDGMKIYLFESGNILKSW